MISAGIRCVVDGREPTLSISNAEDDEETVEGLKRRLEVCAEDNNYLKTNVMRLEKEFSARDMTAKAMALQVTFLEENTTKLMAGNESLRVAKKVIIDLSLSRLCPKRSKTSTKKLSEAIPERYLGLAF